MPFKVNINGKVVKNKNKAVLEVVKQYIQKNREISYHELKNIFPDKLQGSIGVFKNEEDLLAWENDGRKETRKKRFFTDLNDILDLNDDKIYVCTEWGDSKEKPNFTPFIEYVKDNLNFNISIDNSHQNNTLTDKEVKNNEDISTINIKNIILYGSAGIGKTHNINQLIQLIEAEKSYKEIFETIQNNKQIDMVDLSSVKERVKFVTFHQSFGYEDFIEGFRPNGDGKIEREDGVFKRICKDAQENLKNSQKEKSFNFELFFNDFVDYVEKSSSYELEDGLSISIRKSTNGDFKSFQTQGRVKRQSLTYQIIKRDFDDFLNGEISKFEDIKPTFESRNPYHGNARYYFKLYQRMRDFLEIDSDKYILDDIKRQNYYIVIDEINRANISKVFGELITLIEEDKRDVLEVILPYSKEPFSVPSNLYIIGTMNSTDKSIALIDVALRRRFTFLKMVPNSELVYPDIKEKFQQLNRYVSETLGEDYQIGHSYFMNITNSDDLDFILRYKIEPLLEEYFYGDKSAFDKACKIIGIN